MKLKNIFLFLFSTAGLLVAQGKPPVEALAINGEVTAQLAPGTPLILSASISGKSDCSAHNWKLSIMDESGQALELSPQLRKKDDGVTFAGFTTCSALWTIAPANTSVLAPGEYVFRTGTSGLIARLRIVSSLPEDVDHQLDNLLLLSEYAELDGNFDEALKQADAMLAKQANSVAGRIRKSDVLAQQGDLAAALLLLDEAEQSVTRQFPKAHPPILIRQRQDAILARMTGGA